MSRLDRPADELIGELMLGVAATREEGRGEPGALLRDVGERGVRAVVEAEGRRKRDREGARAAQLPTPGRVSKPFVLQPRGAQHQRQLEDERRGRALQPQVLALRVEANQQGIHRVWGGAQQGGEIPRPGVGAQRWLRQHQRGLGDEGEPLVSRASDARAEREERDHRQAACRRTRKHENAEAVRRRPTTPSQHPVAAQVVPPALQ